jgi:hypothetical protein
MGVTCEEGARDAPLAVPGCRRRQPVLAPIAALGKGASVASIDGPGAGPDGPSTRSVVTVAVVIAGMLALLALASARAGELRTTACSRDPGEVVTPNG